MLRIAAPREVNGPDQLRQAVQNNRMATEALSEEMHRLGKTLEEVVTKVRFIHAFVEEYSWRLVHFTEGELRDLAEAEAWRQEKLERGAYHPPE